MIQFLLPEDSMSTKNWPLRLFAPAASFAAVSLVLGLSAWAQFQIDIGPGGGFGVGGDRSSPRIERERDRDGRTIRERGGIRPGVGIQLGIESGQIRPAYCYTYEFGKVITCKKRSLDGETCTGQCILSGDGTAIGPAPPSHRVAAGVSYRCTCGD
jgi:hypothetical protein